MNCFFVCRGSCVGVCRFGVLRLAATLCFAFLTFASLVHAQANLGRISGTITDQTGGAMSGTTVTVLDVERGISRALTTDDAGEYVAPNLTPGTYAVRGQAKGFKALERPNILLEVGHEIRVDQWKSFGFSVELSNIML